MCVPFIDSFGVFHEASYFILLPLDAEHLKRFAMQWLQMELRELALPLVMSRESESVMAEDYKFEN